MSSCDVRFPGNIDFHYEGSLWSIQAIDPRLAPPLLINNKYGPTFKKIEHSTLLAFTMQPLFFLFLFSFLFSCVRINADTCKIMKCDGVSYNM